MSLEKRAERRKSNSDVLAEVSKAGERIKWLNKLGSGALADVLDRYPQLSDSLQMIPDEVLKDEMITNSEAKTKKKQEKEHEDTLFTSLYLQMRTSVNGRVELSEEHGAVLIPFIVAEVHLPPDASLETIQKTVITAFVQFKGTLFILFHHSSYAPGSKNLHMKNFISLGGIVFTSQQAYNNLPVKPLPFKQWIEETAVDDDGNSMYSYSYLSEARRAYHLANIYPRFRLTSITVHAFCRFAGRIERQFKKDALYWQQTSTNSNRISYRDLERRVIFHLFSLIPCREMFSMQIRDPSNEEKAIHEAQLATFTQDGYIGEAELDTDSIIASDSPKDPITEPKPKKNKKTKKPKKTVEASTSKAHAEDAEIDEIAEDSPEDSPEDESMSDATTSDSGSDPSYKPDKTSAPQKNAKKTAQKNAQKNAQKKSKGKGKGKGRR